MLPAKYKTDAFYRMMRHFMECRKILVEVQGVFFFTLSQGILHNTWELCRTTNPI